MTASPTAPPPARRRIWLVAAAALAAVGALYLAVGLLAGDDLPRNTTISGVPVGGLGRDAAVSALTTGLSPRAAAPLELDVGGVATTIDPGEAGLAVDYAGSVDAAGGGAALDPRRVLALVVGGQDRRAEVMVDDARLDAAAAALAQRTNAAPTDAALDFEGARLRLTAARRGVAVDPDAAGRALAGGFLDGGRVVVPADVTEPEVTDEDAEQVAATVGRPAVSGPIRVKAEGAGTFVLTPAMIAGALTFAPDDGSLAPRLDAQALRRNARPALAAVERARPRDATVRLVRGKPRVVPAVDGTQVEAEALRDAVQPVLTATGKDRVAAVRLSGAKAGFSTEHARALGIKEVTGTFTTYFPYLAYRNVNIGRAAELINGTLLKPGEVFSLNKVVGERTKANGFTEGFIINGGKFRKELGGGVSQSATTTFNAMFFAGLKDVRHQPHTLYIDRYPPGREATVAWPNLDLKFANDTRYGVLVQASVVKGTPGRRGSITVSMWSTKSYDKVVSTPIRRSNFTSGRDLTDGSPRCEPMSPVQGFDARYERLFYRGGTVVKREKFFWRYAPTDRVRCV